ALHKVAHRNLKERTHAQASSQAYHSGKVGSGDPEEGATGRRFGRQGIRCPISLCGRHSALRLPEVGKRRYSRRGRDPVLAGSGARVTARRLGLGYETQDETPPTEAM